MRRQTYPMAVFSQRVAQGNKWLNVTSASDDLDDDVQSQGECFVLR